MTLSDENKKSYTVVYDMVRPEATAPWRVRNVIVDGVNFDEPIAINLPAPWKAGVPGP